MVQYVFSVHHHFTGLTWPDVAVPSLHEETEEALTEKFVGVTRVSDSVMFDFTSALSGGESEVLTGVVESHTGEPAQPDKSVTVRIYSKKGALETETVYQDDTETLKERETDYTYDKDSLIKSVKTEYDHTGTQVLYRQTTHYYTEELPDGKVKHKEKRGKKG